MKGRLAAYRRPTGDVWEELLPNVIVKIINEIHGVRRLRELATTDSPFRRKKVVL